VDEVGTVAAKSALALEAHDQAQDREMVRILEEEDDTNPT